MNKFDSKELKVLRIRKGLSQIETAKIIGIGASTYANKESGKAEFTGNELSKVAALFDIRIYAIKEGIFFTS